MRKTLSSRFVSLSLPASSLLTFPCPLENPFARSLQCVEWVLPTSACQLIFAFPRPERGLEPPETRSDRVGLPPVRDAETPDGAGNDPFDEPHMLNRSDQETQADSTESTHRAGSSTEAQRLDVELTALSDEGDASTRANVAKRHGVEAAVGDAPAPAVTRQACARTFGSRMRLSLLPHVCHACVFPLVSPMLLNVFGIGQKARRFVVDVFSSLPYGTRTSSTSPYLSQLQSKDTTRSHT